MTRFQQSFGAECLPRGVRYHAWAPTHSAVVVEILRLSGQIKRRLPLRRQQNGFFTGVDRTGRAGDDYRVRFDHGGEPVPDIASHCQPFGVHGPSRVVDHRRFDWQHAKPPVLLDQLVLYELHLGTFSRAGTFLGAIPHLKSLVELGATAIEIMPVADFPGSRNWGYDGVMLYAPARCYGTPDEFKRLVDAAHGHGLAVILDVVYNHLGPDGNYLHAFHPGFFHPKHQTPWGNGLNFDGPRSKVVREFFFQNALHWIFHYRIDGFRLDSIHSIQDDSRVHFIRELAGRIHRAGALVLAEDERNDASWLRGQKGRHLDGVWVDDFHHTVRVSLKRERLSHFASYRGTTRELGQTLREGWLYRGQFCPHWKRKRGTPGRRLHPSSFIHYISNHDQAGNRPSGERINHLVSASDYRSVSALLCLSPYTPLLWMGQEWAATSPFLFFSDHRGELGRKIKDSRRREFKMYGHHYPAAVLKAMPDPQASRTYQISKLNWKERTRPLHAATLQLYQEALRWRKRLLEAGFQNRRTWRLTSSARGFHWKLGRDFLLSFQRAGRLPTPKPKANWTVVFSSNHPDFIAGVAKPGSRTSLRQGPITVLWRRTA